MVDELSASGALASRPPFPGLFDRDPYIYGIRALDSVGRPNLPSAKVASDELHPVPG